MDRKNGMERLREKERKGEENGWERGRTVRGRRMKGQGEKEGGVGGLENRLR